MTWAEKCHIVLEEILQQHPHDTPERRKAIRDAYPFGERKYWPYKVWCKVVSDMTKAKKIKTNDDQHVLI